MATGQWLIVTIVVIPVSYVYLNDPAHLRDLKSSILYPNSSSHTSRSFPISNLPATIFVQVHSLRVIYQATLQDAFLHRPPCPVGPCRRSVFWLCGMPHFLPFELALQTILTCYRMFRPQVSLSLVLRSAPPVLPLPTLPPLPLLPPPPPLRSP